MRAYKELEERVGNIQTGKGYKSEQIKTAINNRINEFTISDIEKACPGVGRDRIRQVLRLLRDQGVIKSLGIGRSAKWIRVKSMSKLKKISLNIREAQYSLYTV